MHHKNDIFKNIIPKVKELKNNDSIKKYKFKKDIINAKNDMSYAERIRLARNLLHSNILSKLYEWEREAIERTNETENKINGQNFKISQVDKSQFGLETQHFTDRPGK